MPFLNVPQMLKFMDKIEYKRENNHFLDDLYKLILEKEKKIRYRRFNRIRKKSR